MALSGLISLAATATTTPPVICVLISYTAADCAQVGGVADGIQTSIEQDACVNLSVFESYQGGVGAPCPKGTTPKLTLYTGKACSGTAVDAGTLPPTGTEGPCEEISVMVSTTVSVGGQSALFTCV